MCKVFLFVKHSIALLVECFHYMSTFGIHMLHTSPSLYLFVLDFFTVCQSDYHQPSFSTSTQSQTYHLWHQTLLSGLNLNSIISAHNLSNTLFCHQHKVDSIYPPSHWSFAQTTQAEGGNAETSASHQNNQAVSLPTKQYSFPLVVCKTHLLEAALVAISNSIPSLNLPESF